MNNPLPQKDAPCRALPPRVHFTPYQSNVTAASFFSPVFLYFFLQQHLASLVSPLLLPFHSTNPLPSLSLPLHSSEYLVGASPEMFVRIEKTFELPIQATGSTTSNGPPPYLRVETCPISGTVARGRTALEPQRRHRKATGEREGEERADRICVPGSVQLLSKTSIELY